MYSKEDITPEIREKSRRLLGYIKQKIEYKRKDLIRKLIIEDQRTYPVLDEVFTNIPGKDVDQKSKAWEFQLDDPDIIEAITSLSTVQQLVIWNVFIEGNDQEDTAKQLGISPAAVSKAKKRALNELAKKMNKK